MAALASSRPAHGAPATREDHQLLLATYLPRRSQCSSLCFGEGGLGTTYEVSQQRMEPAQRPSQRNLSRIHRNGHVSPFHFVIEHTHRALVYCPILPAHAPSSRVPYASVLLSVPQGSVHSRTFTNLFSCPVSSPLLSRNEKLLADPVRLRQISERIPAGRWGQPKDFAGPVVFLASSASQYVCGELLVVDGVSKIRLPDAGKFNFFQGWMGR